MHSTYLLAFCFVFFFFAQRLYKAAGEDARHQYTMTLGLPEFVQAKTNAANLSDVSLSCTLQSHVCLCPRGDLTVTLLAFTETLKNVSFRCSC